MENVQDQEKAAKSKINSLIFDVEKGIAQGQDQIKNVASMVDKKFRENPWPIVGGVAVVALLLGFVLGSNRGK